MTVRLSPDLHAVVTGGSSGIGRATVDRLAARGVRVSVVALDDAYMAALAAEPPPSPHPLELVAADVGDRKQMEAALAACVSTHGPCHVLVTCAGVGRPTRFEQETAVEFERHMRVNYFGTLWSVRAVLPAMFESRRGSIVCISSAAALFGVFGYGAYAPSKYAVRGLCETLRTELRPHGISVGCVYPSDVDTPMLAAEEPLKPAELRALSGTVRPIPPGQVADAIVHGIETGRARIFTDSETRLLARVFAVAPGLASRLVDFRVARARAAP